jgi:hypothetical protein
LNNGLLNFDWNDVDKFSDEEITYFLSLEGKSMEAMCRIRALTKEEVQRHLIEGKIKYRYLAKSKTLTELFETICNLPKAEKLTLLQALKPDIKQKLMEYIKSEYMNMPPIYKETAIWILGELKDANSLPILQKAVVHKHTNIRRMAVSALGKIGDKASENALIRALEDENPQVVSYAVKALTKIKSERAYDKVKNIYNTTTKEYVKKASEEYMIILEKR